MERLNEKQFENALKRIQIENEYKERNRKLKEEKRKYKPKIKLPSTSKLVVAYLFVVLNIVLFYAMYMMYHFAELTYLGVLITDVASQILVFLIYAVKSAKENSQNGITYEMAMLEHQQDDLEYQQENDIESEIMG